MTADDRLSAFLGEGPSVLSRHVAEAVMDDVRRTRQAAPTPRPDNLLRFVPLVAAAAAVVLIAVALTLTWAGRPIPNVGASSPPSPNPSSSPVSRAVLPDPNPATLAGNGWVAYVQSTALRFASADGRTTVDETAIGDVTCPAFAPVGNLLAYRQDQDLVIASIGERGTVEAQLTVSTPWIPEACPEWAPDGRSIAESVAGEEGAPSEIVGIVSIDGSIHRVQLPGRGWSPWIAWSHDGSSIVAARGREVQLVPLDGGEPQVAYETTTSAYFGDEHYAALESSPAGPYFAVIVPSCREEPAIAETAFSCLRVVGFDGNVVFEEESGGLLTPSESIAWSPDRQQLAWFGEEGIRVRSLEWARSEAITFEPDVPGAGAPVHVDATQGIAWSPDGTRLLIEVSYTGALHEHAIVSVAADGSGDVIVHSGWQTETALIRSVDLAWQRR